MFWFVSLGSGFSVLVQRFLGTVLITVVYFCSVANLDNITRLQVTPPTSRRNKPEVAPKPSPKPTHRGVHATRSREDVSDVFKPMYIGVCDRHYVFIVC